MQFSLASLTTHLPDPYTGEYAETQAERYEFLIDMAVRAEALGFHGVWLGEHHASEFLVAAPPLLLSAIAMRTRSLRLGTAVTLLSINDPVRLAEDYAALDLISKGRAEIGVGAGVSAKAFRLFGHDIANTPEMMRENLDLLERLWNEREVSWSGRFRSPLDRVSLEPRTYSGKAIPIWRAAASSEQTAVDAGKRGHKLMLAAILQPFRALAPMAKLYRAAYRAAGHDPAGMQVSVTCYVNVDANGARSRERWPDYVNNYFALGNRIFAERAEAQGRPALTLDARDMDNAICGDPDRVAALIAKANDEIGGFDHFHAEFDVGGASRAMALESMELFGREVAPRFAAA